MKRKKTTKTFTQEIKRRLTGEVIFEAELDIEHQHESYSVKLGLAVKAAVGQGADLRSANLQGADLEGANLRGANLWGANLQGADLEGEKIFVTPVQLYGFRYNVFISGTQMKVGCELHDIKDWKKFKKSRIDLMAGGAWGWWKEHKPLIMPIAEHHMREHLKAKAKYEEEIAND